LISYPYSDYRFELRCARAHRYSEEVEVSGAERTTFLSRSRKIAKDFKLAIKPTRIRKRALLPFRHFSLGRVGIPAFSISEGLKFKGHDLAWVKRSPKITSSTTTTSPPTPLSKPGISLATPN